MHLSNQEHWWSVVASRQVAGLILLALLCEPPYSGSNDFVAKPQSLMPKYSAETIQTNARDGKFLAVKMFKKPVTLNTFNQMVRKTLAEGRTALAIGVVVDAQNDAWPSDALTAQILGVWKETIAVFNGNKKNGEVGFAERYGARVQGVLPIAHDAGDQITLIKNGIRIQISMKIGDILLAVNDHAYALNSEMQLISSVEELRSSLERYLGSGRHWVTYAEYSEQSGAKVAALRARLAEIDQEIQTLGTDAARREAANARLKTINKKLQGDQVEILLLQGMADSQFFSASTTSGRNNRRMVEAYFSQHDLPMGQQGYDLIAFHDVYKRHAVGLYQRACDADDAKSCMALALCYEGGVAVTADAAKAKQFFGEGATAATSQPAST